MVGKEPLRETFHNIYTMAQAKGCFLADFCNLSGEEGGGGGGGEWGGWVSNPIFLRPFNDWELEEVYNLLASIQVRRLNPDKKGSLSWSLSKSGFFTVKSLYII